MIEYILCLIGLFAATFGSNEDKFISDVMKSQEFHDCEFGYVYDHKVPKVSFEFLSSLER